MIWRPILTAFPACCVMPASLIRSVSSTTRALTETQTAGMAQVGMPSAAMMDGVPFPFVARKDTEITATIDVDEFLAVKLAGNPLPRNSTGSRQSLVEVPDVVLRLDWMRLESYVLARSTVGWPDGVETDLLARL